MKEIFDYEKLEILESNQESMVFESNTGHSVNTLAGSLLRLSGAVIGSAGIGIACIYANQIANEPVELGTAYGYGAGIAIGALAGRAIKK